MAGQPRGPGLAVLIVVQQAVTGQILRGFQAALVEQAGAAHREELQGWQWPHEVGAAVHRAGAVGDRQVDVFAGRRGVDRLFVEVQGDVRITRVEISEATHQPFLRELGGDGQSEHGQRRRIAQFIAGIADQFEGLLQALHQPPGGDGRADLSAFADEQWDAELFFELADLMADGAVGDAQFGGCPAEMRVAGGAFEGAQGGQGGKSSHVGGSVFFCHADWLVDMSPARYPHPSPLPEGEGADRGILTMYADLNVLG
ncbi:hypothetical protein EMIT0232MI5_10270 [Pseudomonas sp. IT-232MI5]